MFKRFGGIEKNTYLCTVKNASAGLKSALNAKLRFFSADKNSQIVNSQIVNKNNGSDIRQRQNY